MLYFINDTVILVTNQPSRWSDLIIDPDETDGQVPKKQSVYTTTNPSASSNSTAPDIIYSQPTYTQSSWASQSKWLNPSAASIYALSDITVVPTRQVHEVPTDHLLWSIFTALCRCWLIGLFAARASIETREQISKGK